MSRIQAANAAGFKLPVNRTSIALKQDSTSSHYRKYTVSLSVNQQIASTQEGKKQE